MGRWHLHDRTTEKRPLIEEQRQRLKATLLRAYQERKHSILPIFRTGETACPDCGAVFFCPGCLKKHHLPQAGGCSCMPVTSRYGDVYMPKLREQVAQQPPARGTVKYNSYPAKRFYRDEDGQHEEDDLFLIEDLFEEDERFYPPRRPNRVERRYYEPITAAQNRNTRRVTRHTRPSVTPRVLSNTASHPAYRVKQEHVKQQVQKHKHWLFYVGGGMLVSVALWIAGSTAFSWLQAEYNNLTYGTPRTFQVDAHVGHQGTSHFIAENLHGDIIVLEIHPSNLAETKIYQGPIFSGNNVDTLIATISFQDVDGDGKPDMVISVGNGRYVLINTGTDFRPTTSSDHIDGL